MTIPRRRLYQLYIPRVSRMRIILRGLVLTLGHGLVPCLTRRCGLALLPGDRGLSGGPVALGFCWPWVLAFHVITENPGIFIDTTQNHGTGMCTPYVPIDLLTSATLYRNLKTTTRERHRGVSPPRVSPPTDFRRPTVAGEDPTDSGTLETTVSGVGMLRGARPKTSLSR